MHDLCHHNYSCRTNQTWVVSVTCKSSQWDRVVSLIVHQITTRLTRPVSHLFALMLHVWIEEACLTRSGSSVCESRLLERWGEVVLNMWMCIMITGSGRIALYARGLAVGMRQVLTWHYSAGAVLVSISRWETFWAVLIHSRATLIQHL